MTKKPNAVATIFGLLFIFMSIFFMLYALGYSNDSLSLGIFIPLVFIALGSLGLFLTRQPDNQPKEKTNGEKTDS